MTNTTLLLGANLAAALALGACDRPQSVSTIDRDAAATRADATERAGQDPKS